jgi:serine/threonine protein kinase
MHTPTINTVSNTIGCSWVNNTNPEYKKYIAQPTINQRQPVIDFNAAKNQFIAQKKIVNRLKHNTTEIDAFINKSKALETNITVHKGYLKDGYFGNVTTGVLKNITNNSVQNIAIKTLKNLDEIPDDYQVLPVNISFFYEVKSLLKLKNQSNIVQLIAAFKNTEEGAHRIILELGDISLSSYNDKFVANEPNIFLSNDNLAYIIKEALLAIVACIKYKIHHLDIHCGNLLIFFQQQKIKLSDFGMVAINYNRRKSALNMKHQLLFCLCECIVTNSKNNPILNEVLTVMKVNITQQLQQNKLPATEENIWYQLHNDYKDKILEYRANNQFSEYFLCFEYFHDVINIADINSIINLISDKFSYKPLTNLVYTGSR